MPLKKSERLRRELERLTRLSADLSQRADILREHADTLAVEIADLVRRSEAAADAAPKKPS
jgi:hypothetical protein